MKNSLNIPVADLKSKISQAIAGVTKNGATLGLPADMGTILSGTQTNLTAADNSYEQAKLDLKGAQATLKSVRKTSYDFATVLRDLLTRSLGRRYKQEWDALGFNGSLRIPLTVNGLTDMLSSMNGYLVNHETAESEDIDITAERAESLGTNLTAAATAVNNLKAARQRAYETRQTRIKEAQTNLRWVMGELSRKIDGLDSRWLEFGFNRPDQQSIPTVPLNMVAVLVGPRAVALKWDRSQRAGYYRVWKKVNGVDEALVAVGSPADLDFAIEGLPANSTIQFAVSAVNSGGESVLSRAVTVVTA